MTTGLAVGVAVLELAAGVAAKAMVLAKPSANTARDARMFIMFP